MGIRFFCPNGHKLNVKANLAGKIGVCPECGAKMRIPYPSNVAAGTSPRPGESADSVEKKSEPPVDSNKSPKDDSDAAQNNDKSLQTRSETPNSSASTSEKIAVSSNGSTSDPSIDELIRQASRPSAKRETARYDNLDDLLKDQAVVWYVRCQNGQEYGPATSETLKSWIIDERVGPDMLVWRQGWTAWQTASDVFPILKRMFAEENDADGSNAFKSPSEIAKAEFDSSTEAFSTLAKAARRGVALDDDVRAISRKKKASKTFALIWGLVGLIVVLLGALIYILASRS